MHSCACFLYRLSGISYLHYFSSSCDTGVSSNALTPIRSGGSYSAQSRNGQQRPFVSLMSLDLHMILYTVGTWGVTRPPLPRSLTLGTSFGLFSLLYKVGARKCARQHQGEHAWYNAWKILSRMLCPQKAQGCWSFPHPLHHPWLKDTSVA